MFRSLKAVVIVLAAIVIAGGVVVRGINARIKAAAVVKQETLEMSVPDVAVIHPKRGSPKDEIALPGNIMAFIDSPIYARTSGYLKKWYADIGTHVKNGQLIAEIESPEVDQQLDQAQAQLETAKANLKLAEITAVRYEGLLKLEAIDKQSVDNAEGAVAADKATVASNEANVKHLAELVGFEKVYAPFDGVITARNTDIGALINAGAASAGTGTNAQEMFHISSVSKLRIFISVPQSYTADAVPGRPVDITLTEKPGRKFVGRIARNADAIDPSTRTLLTEVDIDNRTGELLPGAYAEVHLRITTDAAALIVPVEALIFRAQNMEVAVVREDDKVDLVHITIGRDYGTQVEVTSGITAQDQVIVNPPDSLRGGETVRVEPASKE
ncbi:MAG TPA: efflux RND transporter periplasmic adaptor subunit [Bryobacteraceae bacterium]|jgi:RND family efflux transporter MFP subunit|nr:efflux RND transporter periplasmic adaptor subunit [Bryobacteraceae bacterium]